MVTMAAVSAKVIALEMMTGQLWIIMPNQNQSATPHANARYIISEMALVSLWRMMCSACGTKAPVVRVAASAETQNSMTSLSVLVRGVDPGIGRLLAESGVD